VLPSRKFDLRVFSVNHHARRVVTNKLKTQPQSLEIGTAVQMGPARQSAHIPGGIQSFREGLPWAWWVLSFG